ncbi:hypothetical protein PF005_g27560 [Phytophthora fragariae]|uniref:Uncharacterized protein n=1 Tax=Phytophthora fragariae TaxID=53985 RepID=A0A6A3VN89_9STRA|nr:hypothetical protein PF006_g26455 [Phytophthora fragariae]KAE9170428.1 hypothetical protein PF005_g27560 [Phytophthora fragariae]KAE9176554.1 hypothetical protein PF004_g26046 [Phytophthora fragariae]KAE9177905.1 hypothetical protein PF002_g28216 [Phytophthora fragariae]KAE9276122.1 hypothetical protein PF001_g26279 [Phytophthora fragariae]
MEAILFPVGVDSTCYVCNEYGLPRASNNEATESLPADYTDDGDPEEDLQRQWNGGTPVRRVAPQVHHTMAILGTNSRQAGRKPSDPELQATLAAEWPALEGRQRRAPAESTQSTNHRLESKWPETTGGSPNQQAVRRVRGGQQATEVRATNRPERSHEWGEAGGDQ